jgi:hypothetical protein
LTFGGCPVAWVATAVQLVGLALCIAQAFETVQLSLWVNFVGFGCVIGSLVLGNWCNCDHAYLGPLALGVIPIFMVFLSGVAPLLLLDSCIHRRDN